MPKLLQASQAKEVQVASRWARGAPEGRSLARHIQHRFSCCYYLVIIIFHSRYYFHPEFLWVLLAIHTQLQHARQWTWGTVVSRTKFLSSWETDIREMKTQSYDCKLGQVLTTSSTEGKGEKKVRNGVQEISVLHPVPLPFATANLQLPHCPPGFHSCP